MVFEQLALNIFVGVVMGGLVSVMSFLARKDRWDNRKFGYTMVIAVFSSFAIIEGIEGGIGEENFLRVILEIAGASFITNKAIHMAGRSKALAA